VHRPIRPAKPEKRPFSDGQRGLRGKLFFPLNMIVAVNKPDTGNVVLRSGYQAQAIGPLVGCQKQVGIESYGTRLDHDHGRFRGIRANGCKGIHPTGLHLQYAVLPSDAHPAAVQRCRHEAARRSPSAAPLRTYGQHGRYRLRPECFEPGARLELPPGRPCLFQRNGLGTFKNGRERPSSRSLRLPYFGAAAAEGISP